MSDMYNLQVPINTDTEKTLKLMAKLDGRSLRNYCRKVLEDHIEKQNMIQNELPNTVAEDNMKGYDFNFED